MKRLLLVLLAALLGTAAADVWYVHPDSALNSIQEALDLCDEGDTVLVAADTWSAGYQWPATADIALLSESGPDATVIDGNGSSLGFDVFNVPGTGALIRGFTIANCRGPISGGIDVIQASLSLRDCRLVGNSGRSGGALHCEYGSLTVKRCVVESNSSTLYPPGGLDLGNGCTALVESCLVTRNSNGGISFSDGRTTVIRRCDISGNAGEAVGYSGGGGANAAAENNWWGAASGPWHPSLNPDGQGDTVSDWVDFDPWLAAPVAVAERNPSIAPRPSPIATIVRGVLNLPVSTFGIGYAPVGTARHSSFLLDASGRRVLDLRSGPNDVSGLAPGVYFVCPASGVEREASSVVRFVLAR